MSRVLLAALLVLTASPALAHKPSDSYLSLRLDGEALSGRWDIHLRDLHSVVPLDGNGDGNITWGEIRQREPAVVQLLRQRLSVAADGRDCDLAYNTPQIVEHSDGNYLAVPIAGQCPGTPVRLSVRYSLLFDRDASHRGLLRLQAGGEHTAIFSPERQTQRFENGKPSALRLFVQYFDSGVWHVWSGLDHLLFLAGLFLPAVLTRRGGRWQAAPSLRAALIDTARMVTAFTVAHALTLTVAALGYLPLPSRLVESGVALTVIFAGLNNLLPMVHRRLWLLAGGFGLIHGASIAGILIDLGLPAGSRVLALLAFNLGVEGAQLALVALVVPVSFALRKTRFYPRWIVAPGSVVICLFGLAWLLQRAFP